VKALRENCQNTKKIKIKKMIKTSMIDWEGMIVSTLYVSGCNFRCPFCYNTDLVINAQSLPVISEESVLSFLVERKLFLDGICLSGGEPTLYSDIFEFLKKIKSYDFSIKLDTNGSKPARLKEIIEHNLVDYIAMDIKNCLNIDDYTRTTGIYRKQIIKEIKQSIDMIMSSGIEYEFRTTVIPGFHNAEMIKSIAMEIQGARRYILQNFLQSEEMLDPRLKDVKPYSAERMKDILKKIKPLVRDCRIR